MSKKHQTDSRRKVLKSIAAGSGGIVAGKALPESWTQPVINSVVLPAHAATTDETGAAGSGQPVTPSCCDGVFCEMIFQGKIGGSAQVKDCMITMQGGSAYGSWSGTGAVSADGSFSLTIMFTQLPGIISETTIPPWITTGPPTTPQPVTTHPPAQVTGTVGTDCQTISGAIAGFGSFSGSVSANLTDLDQCFK